MKPLRQLDPRHQTEIWEIDDRGTRKVMKILKDNSPKAIELFEREAMALQLLKHPSIPRIEMDGYFTLKSDRSASELHCLVMEFIEGQNLEQWVEKSGKISQALALNWMRQLIEILEHLHANRFFHRDIKPSNIIIKPDGKLVLIDFGSVRAITETYLVKTKTQAITRIISPGYSPEEQINGQALPQSDFYALGRTFVHLLTGDRPANFPKDSTGQLIWHDRAVQIAKPLAEFIDELMAPQAANRPQNGQAIARGLNSSRLWLRGARSKARSPKYLAVVLSLVGAIGLGIYWSPQLRAQRYSESGRKDLIASQLDSARKNLERAIDLNPDNPIFYSDLGLVCKLQRDLSCAKQQYRKALELKPDREIVATIHYNLGVLYDRQEDVDLAVDYYQKAMQDRGEIGINATNNWARLQIRHKSNYDGAIALLEPALKKTDSQRLRSTLYKNLGWAYLEQANYQKAEDYLREAIRLDNSRAAPHCLLARVLEARGDRREALEFWINCRDSNSENLPEVKDLQREARRYSDASM